MMVIRELVPSDLEPVLALNQSQVPAVGSLDETKLRRLVDMASVALVAEVDGDLAGFVIALPPGVDYGSENYRWFADRYPNFVYVDRIAVSPRAQGRGVGGALYDAVEASTTTPFFLCEVNIRPRNEVSLGFHERRGFRSVGEQDTEGGAKRVVLLEKPLDGGSVG